MSQSPAILSRRGMFRAGAGLLASTAASPLAVPGLVHAEEAKPAAQAPQNGNGFYRFMVGDFQMTVISDGRGKIPVGPTLARNTPEAELAPVLEANFMSPVIQATCNMLVVDTGRQRILIDTGFGEKLGPEFGDYPALEANLRHAGMTPESIDLVVLSHGHIDHIGGLVTKAGTLAFPNAHYAFVDTEWNYWTGSRFEGEVGSSPMPARFKTGTVVAARENLPAIASRTQFIKQGGEVVPGVYYVASPGHSPSHACILFTSGNEQFIYMGDIAHNPATSLQHPEWTPVFDYDPAEAIKSRKAILDRVATDRLLAMGYHFSFPAIGHVVHSGTVFHWEPTRWVW
jgi:glyoxylase-like metal-dependent hydrolase (beta-lactamase superfamily II)